MIRLTSLALVLAIAGAAPVLATNGNGAAPARTAAAAKPAAAPEQSSRPEERAAYDPSGRRDPFISLLSRGETNLVTGSRPTGVRGVLISELSVRGVLRSKGQLLAIVQAPDNKTYTVRPGDTLLDGTVKVVAQDAVIFLQRVDDPLSPVKQREIRKTLRTSEETR